mmetsp:Transcript_16258/g.32971  ORF Transcript_16258/g.32971 Transcript_16258/m.32971 type:complete len:667 (-) Transcript_16258:1667-3667(-)|eukprot:CAMPEP_0184689082 /NCGR_PEP_ID=MMETSP0312-20130426/30458_1 /TAXON_ID=31354 /ORGANISM="Compsopogon coeruleus, Strain SAG 36.94" /LENGTH=666 /DNA_ID=CAMNT_0027146389 /DNA_START=634 /DNA_END=2634 /DNA_ORIENTATION=-
MGIPKFYRWLSERYPLISQYLDESHVFDNFYLDMNGIIHQCTHPNEGEVVIEDMTLMLHRIFDYTDRLYRIVRPQKLLFLAVDGVAPRAKVNQQRSRRFRAAKDNDRIVKELEARGEEIPIGKHFDSNCITPGTQFMRELSQAFKDWIDMKMNTDPAWQQGCTVVFSGSEVPGEGEHKIMDCIREWRQSPNWEPTVRHCMYGLDADLIMLGLVTHEPHFTLLRERISFRGGKRKNPIVESSTMRGSDAEEFELLEIALLRDMLYVEFKPQTARFDPYQVEQYKASIPLQFKYEAHRVVDDFVFMCMLVGNDFVPHIPHLDIAEGALHLMFRTYKELLPQWGGYLTDAHRLHPDRLEIFMKKLAERGEAQFFENKSMEESDKDYRGTKYRSHYYEMKLGMNIADEDALEQLRLKYLEGLHWVLQYYHNGCQSWNWYFPYLYAPLASDMVGLRSLKIRFQRGRPFRPITQLLAVLPPESAHCLPEPYRRLMVAPESPLTDFYPDSFEVDLNGKKNVWEAVVRIPFIDEYRLMEEVRKINAKTDLTPEERLRDRSGKDRVFYARDYPLSDIPIPPLRPSNQFSSRRRSSSTRSNSRSSSSEEWPDRVRYPKQPTQRIPRGSRGKGSESSDSTPGSPGPSSPPKRRRGRPRKRRGADSSPSTFADFEDST